MRFLLGGIFENVYHVYIDVNVLPWQLDVREPFSARLEMYRQVISYNRSI